MADQLSPDLLDALQSTEFDPEIWLAQLFNVNPLYVKDGKKIEELQWTLRQLEAQYAAEFESKAGQYKDQMPLIHSTWSKCISNKENGIISLQQSYKEVLGQVKSRLGSSEFEALNKMIALESTRTKLATIKQMMEDEKKWRKIAADFQEAVSLKDLDTAQARIEELDRLSNTSETKRTTVNKFKQAFVAAVRSS